MTSANPGGEPIVIGNDEAQERLADIADLIVTHDRDIVLRADDSVMRVIEGRPAFIRRARGYVPRAIRLGQKVRPVLALGAHLKTTLCVTRGDEAFVSQHIGDLDNVASIGFLEETIRHFLSILEVEPERVAHDWHPDFHSTILAQSLNLPLVPVQHHHAHLAAIAAEHRIEGELLGLALDGFGLGEQDQSWGGEMLLVDGPFYERLGHLAPLPQPGGDAAAREPWRMAAAVLHRLGRADTIPTRFRRHPKAQLLAAMLDRDFNCPSTTSCGRLFDAACGLLGFDLPVSFEGQAPMLLEGMARRPVVMAGGWNIKNGVLDMLPLLDRLTSCEPEEGANLFHGTLAAALAAWVGAQAQARNLRHVALAGGCMLNAVLSDLLVAHLRADGLEPLIARQVPPNDGGLSLGQAWVAALAPL